MKENNIVDDHMDQHEDDQQNNNGGDNKSDDPVGVYKEDSYDYSDEVPQDNIKNTMKREAEKKRF